jgi:prevent-host-death family protein
MIDVPVRELKAKLSAYLERAARGETIRVTERGRPKAILGPLPGRARLEQGLAEGWIVAPRGRPEGPWRRFRARRSVAEMLAEDRDA